MRQVKLIAAVMLAGASAGTLLSTPAFAETSVFIPMAPPAPRYEVVPAQRHDHVWVPGHWQWQDNGHVWVNGHHLRARQGYHYQQPQWIQQGDRWAYNRGAWARGDRDRDGIPNRFDRDRDNDGVRNRNDRRPNNPNRQ